MDVQLQGVVPSPLRDWDLSASQVWDCDLTLASGNYYLVSSPSGKGKSTLLNILYGIRTDYSGSVRFNGQDLSTVRHNGWADWRQQELSMVFQGLRLLPQLTGWENLKLKNRLLGHTTESRMGEMAEQLGIAPIMDRTCGTWSYGQRQRLAIIRSLLQPFRWLLLDEPFSHLDAGNIAIVSQLIREECERNDAGILLASLGDDYGLPINHRLLL